MVLPSIFGSDGEGELANKVENASLSGSSGIAGRNKLHTGTATGGLCAPGAGSPASGGAEAASGDAASGRTPASRAAAAPSRATSVSPTAAATAASGAIAATSGTVAATSGASAVAATSRGAIAEATAASSATTSADAGVAGAYSCNGTSVTFNPSSFPTPHKPAYAPVLYLHTLTLGAHSPDILEEKKKQTPHHSPGLHEAHPRPSQLSGSSLAGTPL